MQAKSIISPFPIYDDDMKAGRPAQAKKSSFGARLCALREAAGFTQQQMAFQLGISQPSYALWELKEVSLRPEQLRRLSQILGISIEELMEPTLLNRRRGGPTGRARRLFETVSELPRHQQQKILEVVEALLAQQQKAS